MNAGASGRRRRRWPWVAGAVVLLVLAGAVAVRAFFDAGRVAALLLGQASQATGLEWTAGGPADVGLFPHLSVELAGLQVRSPAGERLLAADSIDLALPWRTLFEDTVTVTGASLQRPVLDLQAVSRWRASLPDQGPPPPIELPRIVGGAGVQDGTVLAEGWRIDALQLDAGPLQAGDRFDLEAEGVFRRADAEHPFSLSMRTTPDTPQGALALQDLEFELGPLDGGAPWIRASGRFRLQRPAPLELTLSGELGTWPAAWPPLLPTTEPPQPPRFDLEYAGTPDLQGRLGFALHRGGESLRGELALGDLAGWLQEPLAAPLPPATGTLEAGRLVFDAVELQGVRVRLEQAPQDGPEDRPQPQ